MHTHHTRYAGTFESNGEFMAQTVKNRHTVAFYLRGHAPTAPKRVKLSAQPSIGQLHAIGGYLQSALIIRCVKQIMVFGVIIAEAIQEGSAVKSESGGVVKIAFGVESDGHNGRKIRLGGYFRPEFMLIWKYFWMSNHLLISTFVPK